MTGDRHLVLVGAMGSGKTTIGHLLAPRLGRNLRDNDDELEQRSGRTPAELGQSDGIEALHRKELEVLRDLLADTTPAVITAAASTIADASVRDALRANSLVIWLHADAEDLVDRLSTPSDRPEFDQPLAELVARQAGERSARFREIADADFDTSNATPRDVVDRILALPQLSRCVSGAQ